MSCSDGSWRRCLITAALLAWTAIFAAPSRQGMVRASEPVRLTTDGRLKSDPAFISGGAELVFTVLEKADQTSLIKLRLADGVQERLHPKATTSEFEAAFSADGRYCAFVQNRGNLSLQLVIRDTLEDKDAIFDPGGGFAGMRHPTFAPDASRVVVSNPGKGGKQLLVVGLDGRRGQELTEGESLNFWPAFSPDGKQIAFGSSRDGDFDLYLMNADGGDVKRLVKSPGRDMRPAWSPDGRRIAFTSARRQSGDLRDQCRRKRAAAVDRQSRAGRLSRLASRRPPAGLRLGTGGQFDLYLLDVSEN